MSILFFKHSPLWYACAKVQDIERIKAHMRGANAADLVPLLNSPNCHAFCTSTNTLYVYDMPFIPFIRGSDNVYYPGIKGGIRALPAPAAYLEAFKRFVK